MAYTTPGETRRKVFEFMRERLLAGSPPTLREVQYAFGFRSVESARAQLDTLTREGYLIKLQGRSRGYRLAEEYGGGRPTVLVPLVGQVQAGDLTTAVEEPAGYLPIVSRVPAKELFALRVRGKSMTGAGIFPDDVVIVRRQRTATPGDVVVALVEDEATVKTLRKRKGPKGPRWVLQPENPDFKPITPKPGELRILGKVIEVHRYLENLPLIEPLP